MTGFGDETDEGFIVLRSVLSFTSDGGRVFFEIIAAAEADAGGGVEEGNTSSSNPFGTTSPPPIEASSSKSSASRFPVDPILPFAFFESAFVDCRLIRNSCCFFALFLTADMEYEIWLLFRMSRLFFRAAQNIRR